MKTPLRNHLFVVFLLALFHGQLLAAPSSDSAKKVFPGNAGLVTVATANSLLTCRDTVVMLTGTSTGSRLSYSWTGPGGFVSSLANPFVKTAGIYTLVATDSGSGYTGTDTANVLADTIHPINTTTAIISANNQLTCLYNFVILRGSAALPVGNHLDTVRMAYAWTGPNNFTDTNSTMPVYNPGLYTFTAIYVNNGCTSSLPITVGKDTTAPANLSVQQTVFQLNCIKPSSTITAGSSTPNTTYQWSNSGGFRATGNSITVTAPAYYTVLAIHPITYCTSTATVQVSQSITPPAGVAVRTLSGFNDLTCTLTSQVLSGTSSTAGMSFTWTGPNDYTGSGTQVQVSTAGQYNLLVTSPFNGCTASSAITLVLDTAHPTLAFTANPVSRVISCYNFSIALGATTSAASSLYNWGGPQNFSSSQKNITANYPGDYTLKITDRNNGCTATAVTAVTKDIAIPEQVSASASDRLTCDVTTVTLNGSSFTTGATYKWTGPDNFSVTGASAQTGVAGTYSFTATNPANGCFKAIPVIVSQNIAPPADINAVNSGPLTCAVTEVTLTGSSSSPNVEYQWDGPDGYLSFSAEDVASEPGAYVLTVTNSDNGCTLKDTTIVVNTCGARRAISNSAASTVYANASPAFDRNGDVHYLAIRVNNRIYTKKLVAVK